MDAIRPASRADLDTCLSLIRGSFRTVAEELGLTEETCPGHTAFLPRERLEEEFGYGNPMFLYESGGEAVGFVSLRDRGNGLCELSHLCVLPAFRRRGIGEALVRHCRAWAARELGAERMTIGIVEDTPGLKAWYMRLGFVPTGTRRFPHLPFLVGFLEVPLDPPEPL